MHTTLISTSELEKHIGDPDWVIVDCRFELADKTKGERDYRAGHIPGAVFADLEKDLCSPITPQSGRHPLPDPDEFIQTLRRLGVCANSQVIVYDTSNDGQAAHLWFLLRYYGHNAVAVLDGGMAKWITEGRETVETVTENLPGDFDGLPHESMLVSTAELRGWLGRADTLLIDSRAAERYRGDVEPIDAIAGHIPGAVNRPWAGNLGADGLMLPADRLKAELETLMKGHAPELTAVYCGSGVTACHNLLAIVHAGLPPVRLYAGSWSEWIRDTHNPVAKG